MREQLAVYSAIIDDALEVYLDFEETLQDRLVKAARHSVFAGGKRIRPVLALEFGRLCGGDIEKVLPAACAVELLHTFSLIHDDLPSMDNDDMRRGKPSCHKAFGEGTALLAGDMLAIMPFQIIAEAVAKFGLEPQYSARAAGELASFAGALGMIGGQVLDTELELETEAEILDMYRLKTCALLKAACRMGCIAAGADEEKIEAAGLYGESLGLAFQLVDDILDIVGDEDEIGKPVGSDSKNDKNTYAAKFGIEKAGRLAQKYTEKAISALDIFADTAFLKELTEHLLERTS